MAHLWIRDDQGWAILPLRAAEGVELSRLTAVGQPDLWEQAEAAQAPAVVSVGDAGGESWAVFTSPAHRVRVNGLPVGGGMRVLCDRDEIAVGDRPGLFFAAERLAAVGALPSGGQVIDCARCRQPIEPGSAAVCCPRCGLWHHETEPLPCWTHVPECAMCPQPTGLDEAYRWTPEGL